METIDDETTDAAVDFMQRQVWSSEFSSLNSGGT
jgi:hypothetical protein